MNSGRERLKKISGIIKFLIMLNSILPVFINKALFIYSRNISGKFGMLIRYVLFKNLSNSCGDNVSIHEGVYLKGLANISVGSNLSIHSMCYIDGTGGLKIGNDVSIAHASTIMTTGHTYNDPLISIKYNETHKAPVILGNDIWIGAGCRILGGVTIGTRSIIAAGAVINKTVEPKSIVGGVPGKKIKNI